MLDTNEKNRYSRHLLLDNFGEKKQLLLKNSSVLIIGAGGLGCPVLQYIAAAGVGAIGIVDFDVIEESNLQRQVLFETSDVGSPKATVAQKRIQNLNPSIRVDAFVQKLDQHLCKKLIPKYDVIVDCTDNFSTRYMINDACVLYKKPLVYGAIFKYEGQVAVFNYSPDSPSYRCLFSSPPENTNAYSCNELGVLGVLPGVIGVLQANEVIKICTQSEDVLSGKMFHINLLTMQNELLEFEKSNQFPESCMSEQAFLNFEYDFSCERNLPEHAHENISPEKLKLLIASDANVQLIDVRNEGEHPQVHDLQMKCIPLNELQQKLNLLDKSRPMVLICKSGIRSLKAIELLMQNNFKNKFYNLDGGIMNWIKNN